MHRHVRPSVRLSLADIALADDVVMWRAQLLLPMTKEFLDHLAKVRPLWQMGTRKKPPKLPERCDTNLQSPVPSPAQPSPTAHAQSPSHLRPLARESSARGNFRMIYARVTTMHMDEVEAAVASADVVVVNWGLHYQKMAQYTRDLQDAFKVLDR